MFILAENIILAENYFLAEIAGTIRSIDIQKHIGRRIDMKVTVYQCDADGPLQAHKLEIKTAGDLPTALQPIRTFRMEIHFYEQGKIPKGVVTALSGAGWRVVEHNAMLYIS